MEENIIFICLLFLDAFFDEYTALRWYNSSLILISIERLFLVSFNRKKRNRKWPNRRYVIGRISLGLKLSLDFLLSLVRVIHERITTEDIDSAYASAPPILDKGTKENHIYTFIFSYPFPLRRRHVVPSILTNLLSYRIAKIKDLYPICNIISR